MLTLLLILPFLGSLAAAALPANARNVEAWLAGGVALACTGIVIALYPDITAGGVISERLPWLPQFDIDVHIRMDGFAWLFALLVSFIGALVVLYARYYMAPEDPVPRFFSFLLAFMGAMLGVVLSGNLIQLVVFWELTSLTSFMLIAYWYHLPDARRAARMSLIVTFGGGLCLLLGALMIGEIVGSYDLGDVLAAGDVIRAHRWYGPAVVLVVIGVLTKSAQFPFHFWLPQAMTAPTPVSAYLHSATMVKAGVFLLARLWPALAGTPLWFWLVCSAGALSLLIGAFSATFQRDLKGVLAYSTISHLGLITLLLGMNSELALVAAVFHMMNHATFKASLFMGAGIVQHETGTRDIQRLGGLARSMPITAAVTTVAAAAMAGVPLLNGFLSKEMFFEESIVVGRSIGMTVTLPTIATIAGIFSVAYSLRLVHQVFFGREQPRLPSTPHEPTRGMLVPGAMLVAACLLVGVLPSYTLGPLLETAMVAILGEAVPDYRLAVWHGFTAPFFMSLVALFGGVAFYTLLYRRGKAMMPTPVLSRLNARRMFDVVNVAIVRGAARATHLFFTRRMQSQLLAIVGLALIAGILAFGSAGYSIGPEPFANIDPLFALLWVTGAACAIGAAQQAKLHRLAALIMLGGAGLVTCLTFAWFAAPDLALTQIAVEVVTVVLLLLGLRWLPRRSPLDEARRNTPRARARRARDFVLAALAGTGAAALALAVMTRPNVSDIPRFFLDNALDAGGRNVVNITLVDYRALDTLGEITVVGIVALIVYALLRRFRPAPESIEVPRAQRDDPLPPASPADELLPAGYMRLPAVLVRLLGPMAGLVSVYFLFRGHNLPGGGFVGGLVMAIAVIVQYMVGGTMWVESRLRIHPQLWLGLGLIVAGSTGIAAWFAGQPYLSSLALDVHVPLLGELHLQSVLLFDLGVYMLVIGAVVLMLVAIAHQSLRSPRRPAAEAAVVAAAAAALDSEASS